MFVGMVLILILASVPLCGGRLGALPRLRLRAPALLFGALAVQILLFDVVPRTPVRLAVPLHLVSYLAAAAWLWLNRRLRGVLIVALGAASNGIVIALNGGTLPASAAALRRAGLRLDPADYTNSGVLPHPHLAALGDVVATPAFLPFRNVFSIGDAVILIGALVLVHCACGTRPAEWAGRVATRLPYPRPA